MADIDPLEYRQRRHPDLDVTTHGLTLWDLDRDVRHRRLRRRADAQAAQDPRHPARLVLPHRRHRVHAHPGPRPAQVDPGQARGALRQDVTRTSSCGSCAGSTPPRRSRRSCRPSSSARSGSASRAASRSSRCSTAILCRAAGEGLDEVVHRHAAPRPPQRAGQHRRQVLRADLPRVRGQAGPEVGPGLRRREVPPRHRGQVRLRGRRHDQGLPGGQPLPPRGGRPGARGHRPGQAGPARPRRRGVHRPARCSCTATRPSPARASWPRR